MVFIPHLSNEANVSMANDSCYGLNGCGMLNPISHVEALTPNMMAFAGVPFGGKRLDEGMPVESP